MIILEVLFTILIGIPVLVLLLWMCMGLILGIWRSLKALFVSFVSTFKDDPAKNKTETTEVHPNWPFEF